MTWETVDRLGWLLVKWLATVTGMSLLLACLLLTACTSTPPAPLPPVVHVLETERLAYVPVPEGLTEACAVPTLPDGQLITADLITWIRQAAAALHKCNHQLREIAALEGKTDD